MSTFSNDLSLLPVVVGITGHRDIPEEAVAALEKQVESLLLQVKKQYPHCPVIVLSSLADGADRLAARAALKAECMLQVPLPMPLEDYEKDFGEASKREFHELLSHAEAVFIAGAGEPVPKDSPPRGFYYRQAGLYVAQHSHILIALWDGEEKLFPDGGGTYETLRFMQRENGIVCHVPAPRLSETAAALAKEAVVLEQDDRLSALDSFNAEISVHKDELDAAAAENKPYLIDKDTEKTLEGALARLLHCFLYADALSVKYRNLKLLTLRLLSALGLLLVLAFLGYDELESDLMLFVYGAIIIAAGTIYLISSRRGFHEKYIRFRALAEALRVQFYWNLGGIADKACLHYTYTQKAEMDFVRFAFVAINGLRDESAHSTSKADRDCVCRFWLHGQHGYHSDSALKKGKQDHRNASAAKFMFIASILLFVAVVVMELFFKANAQEEVPFGDAVRSFLIMHHGQAIVWRGMLKIALGAVSAATAFLANYYGSLSLPQQIFDNRRMRVLFESALHTFPSDEAEYNETLRCVGRESVIESGAWYLMQRDNAQQLFI